MVENLFVVCSFCKLATYENKFWRSELPRRIQMKFSFKMLTTKFVTASLALTVAFSASTAILMPQPVQAYSKNIQTGINLITTANWYLGVRYKYGAKTNIEYE